MKKFTVFLPLLIVYVALILAFSSSEPSHDEPANLSYAQNITEGFYTSADYIDLTKPPSYPLFLSPFVAFEIPLVIPKLINAVFLFLAVFYFYHTLLIYMEKKYAIIGSYVVGLFPTILLYLHLLIAEAMALLLICGFVFHFSRMVRNKQISWKQLLFSSLYLAFLALTKSIFGYVLTVGLAVFFVLYILRKKTVVLKSLLVFLLALLFCLPYLAYTYSLTGEVFYWGTNGGELLYWMATPYPDEYGEWWMDKVVLDWEEYPQLYKNHGVLFRQLLPLSPFQRDAIFRQRAINNIVQHPLKYFQNWIANIGRLLFNYPLSYTSQKLHKFYSFIPSMFLVVVGVLCVYPSWKGRIWIPFEIKALFFLTLVYLGGTSLISARIRYLIVALPPLVLWISFVLRRMVKLEVKNADI